MPTTSRSSRATGPPLPDVTTSSAPLELHVVAHTHWDREWYHPLGRFRQRLVELVDELLDTPDGAPFLLDGQAIVVEDYLAVRPERRDLLARRLGEGALEAGPWYVLADELIPSGEALVRNLLVGRATLRALGASAPPVLYCPDSFGHPATLPTLARGFGLDLVLLWRGYGGARWPAGDLARWRAPDGSLALLYHLPPSGYELGSDLPHERAEALARWQELRDVLVPRARAGVALLHNGADHHARQEGRGEAVRRLTEVAEGEARVRESSLAVFAGALRERAGDRDLPTVEGELRDSYGYTWTLQGTFASRAHQKRANAHAERLLLRDAEPWAALARLSGKRDFAPHLAMAWRTLLACHPHDTLCGCSVDAVACAMDARLEDAMEQGRGIRRDAILGIVGHDEVRARTARDAWRPLLLLRNASARRRGGVAEVELEGWLADVGVGPGSRPPEHVREMPRLSLGDYPLQRLSTTIEHRRTESPRHYPDNDRVAVVRALAWVPAVDGFTITPLPVSEAPSDATAIPAPARAGRDLLENDRLRVTVAQGRVTLGDTAGAWSIESLLAIEDDGDRGDLYTHSRFGRPVVRESCRRVAPSLHGPLRAALRTSWPIRIPSRRDPRLAHGRSTGGAHDVHVELQLDAGAPFLRILVDGENRATDHRLRLRLRTGVKGGTIVADAAFGPVERRPIRASADDRRHETPPPTAPLHRWVAVANAGRGFALISDGLAEYEVDAAGDILVTLVRAVGELSRNDLPERPGHAGWPESTPLAQCAGRFAAALALLPIGALGAATLDDIERAADDALLPLVGGTLRSAYEDHAASAGLTLEGAGLVCTAVKPAEGGAGIIVRCVNVTDGPVQGSWRVPPAVSEARLARLDETPLEPLPLDGGAVRFEAPPRAVVTLLLR
jgi:mannosylglycerate hydrolase